MGLPPAPKPEIAKANQQDAKEESEWLIMIYMAGANNLGHLALQNINQIEKGLYKAGKNADPMKIAVAYSSMQSTEDSSIKIPKGMEMLLVQPDNNAKAIKSKPFGMLKNADTGNIKTLEVFIHASMTKFPARKKALLIWNHGKGIDGIASDSIYDTMMGIRPLGLMLDKITNSGNAKFDVIAMDACVMQMAEVAYELKEYADYIVASEQIIPNDGYPYEKIMYNLSKNRYDAKALTEMLVHEYNSHYSDYDEDLTYISSVKTAMLPEMMRKLNRWAGMIVKDRSMHKKVAENYPASKITRAKYFEISADFVDLIDKINGIPEVGSEIAKAGEELKKFMLDSLFSANYQNKRGRGEDDNNFGIGIYFPYCPEEKMDMDKFNEKCRYRGGKYASLKFSQDSAWDEFIQIFPIAYYEKNYRQR